MTIRMLMSTEQEKIARIAEIEAGQFQQSGAMVLEAVEHPNMHILVCDEDERFGYLWYQFAGDYSEIISIYVEPAARKQGLASRLLAEYMKLMRAGTVATISLEVRKSNVAAQKLYAANGFVAVGNRKNYYRQPVEDGIIFNYEIV